jgi:type VI secretion system protein VasJ
MLGAIGSSLRWRWIAFGKHPVANDFFNLGEAFSLGKGFSEWVGSGYRVLVSKGRVDRSLCSWRFWTRGSQKGLLACGLLRDSSDRVGRPFPLLIMGMGPLKGWEEEWDLLPCACEKTWNQIESLSALMSDMRKLETEVGQIRSPQAEWSEYRVQNGGLIKGTFGRGWEEPPENLNALEGEMRKLSEDGKSFVPLGRNPSEDRFEQICRWHSMFKAHSRGIPNAVFMGGTSEKPCLAAFGRPLNQADFIRLWSREEG